MLELGQHDVDDLRDKHVDKNKYRKFRGVLSGEKK